MRNAYFFNIAKFNFDIISNNCLMYFIRVCKMVFCLRKDIKAVADFI